MGAWHPQPLGQPVCIEQAQAQQIRGGRALAPFEGDAPGSLGVGEGRVDGVAPGEVLHRKVIPGGALGDGQSLAPAPLGLGQELEQQGTGDLAHGSSARLGAGRSTGLSAASARRASGLMNSVSRWTVPPSR